MGKVWEGEEGTYAAQMDGYGAPGPFIVAGKMISVDELIGSQ